MSLFFAILRPPSRKDLVIDLAKAIGAGLAETKKNWDSENPVLFMGLIDDRDAFEHARQFEILFKWADANGVAVSIYESPWINEGHLIDKSQPVSRDAFQNAVRMMEGIAEEVSEAMEREASMSACPCCSSESINEPGGYELCRVCGWEDDPSQEAHPDMQGGANDMSLTEARAWWNGRRQKIPPNGTRPQRSPDIPA